MILGADSLVLSQFGRLDRMTEEEWALMVRRNPKIEAGDIPFVRRHCRDCRDLAGEISGRHAVRWGNRKMGEVRVYGATSNLLEMGRASLSSGRFLLPHEVERAQRVCVIGWDLKERVFPQLEGLGQLVRVEGMPLKVVGVLARQGSRVGLSLDSILYMPLHTYARLTAARPSLMIRARAHNRKSLRPALDQVRAAMRLRHRLKPNEEDDFGLFSRLEVDEAVGRFTGSVALVVLPISLIALGVGGIVVMNVMLVSVAERTYEIGLRKALGARRQDILRQFLIEAVLLTSLGGVVGLQLAWLALALAAWDSPVPLSIEWRDLILAVGTAAGVGLVSGIYPGSRAARLEPVLALTQEL